jgi:hypothetical protein
VASAPELPGDDRRGLTANGPYIGSQKFCLFRRHVTNGNDGLGATAGLSSSVFCACTAGKPAVAPKVNRQLLSRTPLARESAGKERYGSVYALKREPEVAEWGLASVSKTLPHGWLFGLCVSNGITAEVLWRDFFKEPRWPH